MSLSVPAVSPPLVAHVIHRLDVGGLENGVVNLINRMPESAYRHAVVCLEDYTDYRGRIQRDVPVFALHKREGQDLGLYGRLWRVFRQLKPDIVHTRNLATLEAQLPSFLARVRGRVHGEHGWDVADLHGANPRYRLLRRAFRPLVQRYVALSRQIEGYLEDVVGVPRRKLVRICNGVDAERFRARNGHRKRLPAPGFDSDQVTVIGTVGRMAAVKDQLTLARAFVKLVTKNPGLKERLRLVMVGEGHLREEVRALLDGAGLGSVAWLPGSRDDVPALMRAMDVFVLPSRAEGISNTILEAMASALPVVATDVGGNAELVSEGQSGYLVPAGECDAMVEALEVYVNDPGLAREHGRNGRLRVEREFSLDAMIGGYTAVYDQVFSRAA